MTEPADSLEDRLDAEFAPAWTPEPGEKLIGVVVAISERETTRAGKHVGGDAKAFGVTDDVVEEQQRAFLLGHQLGQTADLEVPVRAVDVFKLADARGAVDKGSEVGEGHEFSLDS